MACCGIGPVMIGFTKLAFQMADKLSEERLKVCGACEFNYKGRNWCKKCKCFLPAKTRVNTEECPLKKWGKVSG